MKKILIITHWGGIAGGNVSLMQVALTLDAMSEFYRVYVYCPNYPQEMLNWLNENQIEVIDGNAPITLNHYMGSDRPIFTISNIKNIIQVLTKKGLQEISEIIINFKPDIVMLNSMTMFWMGNEIKKLGAKSVCFNRETYAKGTFGIRTYYIKRNLKKYFDGVIFISENDQLETGEIKGVSKVITDKVDIEKYVLLRNSLKENRCVSNNGEFVVLFLGGMSRLKGAHVIIKALSKLKNENIKLVFLKYELKEKRKTGSDCATIKEKIKFYLGLNYEAYVLGLINKYDLWEKIDFHATVKNPEKFIVESDLLVFPSTKPHQARPLYEAGAAKVPIIITEFKQTKEFAINGHNCLTFAKENHKQLAELILSIKENKRLRDKLVKNNYLATKRKHDLRELANELKNFLGELK